MNKRLRRYYRRRYVAQSKACTSCGCTLSAWHFNKCLWNESTGLESRCKDCDNLRHVLKTRKRSELSDYHAGRITPDRKMMLFAARPRLQDTHAAQELLGWREGGPGPLHPSLKTCTNCGRTLDKRYFKKRSRGSRDGLSSWCTLCNKVARKGRHVPKLPRLVRYTPTIYSLLSPRQALEGALPSFKPLAGSDLTGKEK